MTSSLPVPRLSIKHSETLFLKESTQNSTGYRNLINQIWCFCQRSADIKWRDISQPAGRPSASKRNFWGSIRCLYQTSYLFQHCKTSWCSNEMKLWKHKWGQQSPVTHLQDFWNLFILPSPPVTCLFSEEPQLTHSSKRSQLTYLPGLSTWASSKEWWD